MKLRGAISGFGEVAARAHLSGWLTRDDVSIRAVHEPIAERRHEAIRLIRNVRVYEDLELMLDGEALDFVDIASPPAMHAPAARLALKAGAHVLVEKPLCLSLAEFDELAALAAGSGRVLMCVHNWKHAPSYALARDLLDRGRIGTVRSLSIERLRTAPAGAGGAGGRWRSSGATGGGILIDHGWHVFYLMQWLMGERRPTSIAARLQTFPPGKVEEVAGLTVSFEDGALGYIHLSWRAPARRTSAMLYGDAGMLEIEGGAIRLTSRAGGVEDLSVTEEAENSYHPTWFAALAREFETAIAQGPRGALAEQNQREAATALAMLEAAKASHNSGGRSISLPTLPFAP